MLQFLNQKRGQSTLEYAVLIVVIIGALLTIQTYIKRGVQGRLKSAADDIGDAVIMIVHHHRQHIGRRAVAPQHDHIVHLVVRDRDRALHPVLDDRLADLRRTQPDRR